MISRSIVEAKKNSKGPVPNGMHEYSHSSEDMYAWISSTLPLDLMKRGPAKSTPVLANECLSLNLNSRIRPDGCALQGVFMTLANSTLVKLSCDNLSVSNDLVP